MLQTNARGAKLHAVPERKRTVKRYLLLGLLLVPAIGCGGGQPRTSAAARGETRRERHRESDLAQSPRAETLAVTWVGSPEQALIYGWPTDLGPFGGIGAAVSGDSLRGAILFEQRVGIQVTPGTTARFVAGRAR